MNTNQDVTYLFNLLILYLLYRLMHLNYLKEIQGQLKRDTLPSLTVKRIQLQFLRLSLLLNKILNRMLPNLSVIVPSKTYYE